MDIKDGKLWIENNATDQDIAEELMAAGVEREHIVLAFLPPHRRKYSEFPVG